MGQDFPDVISFTNKLDKEECKKGENVKQVWMAKKVDMGKAQVQTQEAPVKSQKAPPEIDEDVFQLVNK
uniref:Uncharacterized protein n=1 Tax=Cannabis sativa TaxID=3483 RepID=A0A803NGL5_CANSA